jgi:probable FeS assembly SUF system protein SufT
MESEVTVSNPRRPIVLNRQCPVTLVPSGERIMLAAGEAVVLVQHRGGAATIQTERGYLARVAPKDLDALGLKVSSELFGVNTASDSERFEIVQVIDALREVFDPEIPVNVIDLGLIYRCEATRLPGGGQRVEIEMSMTAPGCGMGDVLKEEARVRAQSVAGVEEVNVDLVWDPPWSIARMSEAARLELGLL